MPIKKVYFSDGGLPKTGLVPVWNGLKKVSDGSNFTPQPTFTEVGLGWYKFTINPSEALVGVIDGTSSVASNTERYVPVYFDKYDYMYEVFVQPVYDEDTDSLTFLCFLSQNGQRVTTGLVDCTINVYNSAHSLQFTLTTTSQTNGVFVLTKTSPGLIKNTSYYAVAIIDDGVEHDSTDSYISIE
jgi:WD40 repeat protein